MNPIRAILEVKIYDTLEAFSDIEAFREEPIPKANKIHWELALPTVKTPPDLTIDNRPSALNQSRFNASSVYEWNIDGMSGILLSEEYISNQSKNNI